MREREYESKSIYNELLPTISLQKAKKRGTIKIEETISPKGQFRIEANFPEVNTP